MVDGEPPLKQPRIGHSSSLIEMEPAEQASAKALPSTTKVAVIGGGSFGLAMASIVGRKGIPTCILVRKEEVAAHINAHHSHPQYLKDFRLADTITSSADPKTAFEGVNFILHCIPVQYSRQYLLQIAPFVPPDVPIISTSKL
ncbi:hypothetical protein VYU27_007083 [Nannochloropsis oceanica]